MKKLFYSLVALVVVSVFACNSKPATDASTATTEVKKEMAKETPMTSSEPYTTTVLNGDIASPRKEMKGMIDGAAITINYGSPYAKGRKIMNGLIPFGKVWRTGANEATTFETSKDLMVDGKKLPAGKYGLFTLSNEGSTQVIFNSVHDQWGAYKYDESKDVLRLIITPSVNEVPVESMDFKIIGNSVVLVWEKVAMSFDVEAA